MTMNSNSHAAVRESNIQQTLVQYIQRVHPGAWRVTTSVPHGGYRLKSEAARLKREGVHAGYPDMLIDQPVGRYHGMRLEIKTAKGSLSKLQLDFLTRLAERDYFACVGYGIDACIHLTDLYMKHVVLRYCANHSVVECSTPPLLCDVVSREAITIGES